MGKVVVTAKIESLEDLLEARREAIEPNSVRSATVTDALIDTGATMLSLPQSIIERLGLMPVRKRTARTTTGIAQFTVHDAVRLTIEDRDCVVEVAALPDDGPVLIGQIPLEALDFAVDPVGQRLIGNPEHGGEQMIDMFLGQTENSSEKGELAILWGGLPAATPYSTSLSTVSGSGDPPTTGRDG